MSYLCNYMYTKTLITYKAFMPSNVQNLLKQSSIHLISKTT